MVTNRKEVWIEPLEEQREAWLALTCLDHTPHVPGHPQHSMLIHQIININVEYLSFIERVLHVCCAI